MAKSWRKSQGAFAVQVTDTSLRLLGRHTGLADVRLEECPALTDAGLHHLSGQQMCSSGREEMLRPFPGLFCCMLLRPEWSCCIYAFAVCRSVNILFCLCRAGKPAKAQPGIMRGLHLSRTAAAVKPPESCQPQAGVVQCFST